MLGVLVEFVLRTFIVDFVEFFRTFGKILNDAQFYCNFLKILRKLFPLRKLLPEKHNVVVWTPLYRRYNSKMSKRLRGVLTVNFIPLDDIYRFAAACHSG